MAVAAPGCFLWMGMRPMLQAWPGFPRSLAACVACAALVAVGCTMCPDPYDYSGPVPNGSAPQNDFRARSNGILPIGATPKPYPTVVKAAPQPAPVPAPVVEKPVMAEAEDDVLRLSAEAPVVAESDADEVPVPTADATAENAPPSDGEVAVDAAGAVVQGEATDPQPAPVVAEAAPEATPQPVPVAAEPPLRETPGWRTRR